AQSSLSSSCSFSVDLTATTAAPRFNNVTPSPRRRLYLRPCEQPGKIARLAARFVHEEALECREPLHRAKPGAADGRGGAPGDSEEAGQTIGRQADHQIVEPAPALVAGKQRRIPEVEPEARAVDQGPGQRRGGAKPGGEPLPRNRMDAVRRVADKRDPVSNDRRAVVETERINHPRCHELHRA